MSERNGEIAGVAPSQRPGTYELAKRGINSNQDAIDMVAASWSESCLGLMPIEHAKLNVRHAMAYFKGKEVEILSGIAAAQRSQAASLREPTAID